LRHALVHIAALYFLTSFAAADVGSLEQREALFDYLLESTLGRTAFSPEKPNAIGLPAGTSMAEHVEAQFLVHRHLLVDAETDDELYRALSILSNVRRDTHLGVNRVDNGITPNVSQFANGPHWSHAPLKFKPDYGDLSDPYLFVSDFSQSWRDTLDQSERPQIGDRLIAINGQAAEDFLSEFEVYRSESSDAAMWWAMSFMVPVRVNGPFMHLYRNDNLIEFGFRRPSGEEYQLTAGFEPYDQIDWALHDNHWPFGEREGRQLRLHPDQYPDYVYVESTETYDLFRGPNPSDPILLQWHRFPGRQLEADIEHLLDYARENDLVAAGLIIDATMSTGGNRGAWALQRLQNQAFVQTFGNLRNSDVTVEIADALAGIAQASIDEHGGREEPFVQSGVASLDTGTFLLDWINEGIRLAIAADEEYSPNAPFKARMLPWDSDGGLTPVENALTGPLVVLLGPYGCSHIDQFAAMVIDNELGHTIGMPAGGCSNTWEYEEILTWPGTDTPIVEWQWTIGQTIRPNGEVLEGNPAMPAEYVPMTSENYPTYRTEIFERARAYVQEHGGR